MLFANVCLIWWKNVAFDFDPSLISDDQQTHSKAQGNLFVRRDLKKVGLVCFLVCLFFWKKSIIGNQAIIFIVSWPENQVTVSYINLQWTYNVG